MANSGVAAGHAAATTFARHTARDEGLAVLPYGMGGMSFSMIGRVQTAA